MVGISLWEAMARRSSELCAMMLEQNILIGGEESGGIGTSLYLPEPLYEGLREAAFRERCKIHISSWRGFGWPWVSGVGSSRGRRRQA